MIGRPRLKAMGIPPFLSFSLPAGAWIAAAAIAAGGITAYGAQELRGDAVHRGVVDFAPYQIFPENRPDNAVYFENRLIFTVPNETILQLLPLPKEGRFAYAAAAADGTTRVGLFLQPPNSIRNPT